MCKFGDIATGFDYGMNAAAKPFDGENKYIRITDIDEVSSTFNDKDLVSPDGTLTDSYVVNDRDILLARTGASTGKSYLYRKNDGKLYYAGFLIRANVPEHDPYFVFSQLHTHRYWRWVSIMSARSGQPGINSQEYSSFPIFTTSLQEESKISTLLSLLDERIATQNKIIEDLKKLKSAIVDILIIHNPNTTDIPLSMLCKEAEQNKEEKPTYERIITVKLHCKGVCQSSADNLDLGSTQYYVRRSGQLIYGKQNFHNGAIGIVPKSLDMGLTSKDIPSFDIHSEVCNPSYLLYYLQYPSFYKSAEAFTTGSGSKRLKERDFLKIHISLPGKDEQDTIASFLIKISTKIKNEVLILEIYNKQRKYLLSQMFI